MLSTSVADGRVFRAASAKTWRRCSGHCLSCQRCRRGVSSGGQRGAQPLEEPRTVRDEYGSIRRAAIQTYGDTIHSLISFQDYAGPFLPGFKAADAPGRDAGILRIDHIVGNVELGKDERVG